MSILLSIIIIGILTTALVFIFVKELDYIINWYDILTLRKSDILLVEIDSYFLVIVKDYSTKVNKVIINTKFKNWYMKKKCSTFLCADNIKHTIKETVLINIDKISFIDFSEIHFTDGSYYRISYESENEIRGKWQYIIRDRKLKELLKN